LPDLAQFWQRASFFVALEAALVSVFASLGNGQGPRHEASLMLAVFGFALASYWGWIGHLTFNRIKVCRGP
jgi:hypothetical protein